jgi:hypothetical protein
VRLDLMLNGQPVVALARVVHRRARPASRSRRAGLPCDTSLSETRKCCTGARRRERRGSALGPCG